MDAPAGLSRVSLALLSLLGLAVLGTALAAEGAGALRPSTTPAPTRSPAPDDRSDPTSAPKTPPPAAVAKRRRPPDRGVDVALKDVFARVGGVALVHPANRVERVAFHQASDIASLELAPAGTAARPKVLPSRHRPTSPTSAVDVVVDPGRKIRAPVSGVVKRAGNYLLYCKHSDAFAVISPDGHPELEVKLLHVSGLRVRKGDRIVAGKTLIAERATKLPFGSQVDAFTNAPAWPHVHMEVTKLEVPSATPVAGPSTLAFSQCG